MFFAGTRGTKMLQFDPLIACDIITVPSNYVILEGNDTKNNFGNLLEVVF